MLQHFRKVTQLTVKIKLQTLNFSLDRKECAVEHLTNIKWHREYFVGQFQVENLWFPY